MTLVDIQSPLPASPAPLAPGPSAPEAPPPAGPLDDLVRRHIDLVYSAALRQVRDPHFAADVTQAVFLILQTKFARIRPENNITAWLLRTTHYVCLAALRSQRRRMFHEQKAAAMRKQNENPSPDSELATHLDAALEALSAQDRSAIVMSYFEGLSHPQVANRLHISEDAAHKRVQRAMARLRKIFVRKGAAVPPTAFAAALAVAAKPSAAPAAVTHAVNAALAGNAPTAIASLVKAAAFLANLLKAKTAGVVAAVVLAALFTGTVVYRIAAPPRSRTAASAQLAGGIPDNGASVAAQLPPGKLIVNVDHPGANISPLLHGLALEEINHAFDGGLYAELIQNRDFGAPAFFYPTGGSQGPVTPVLTMADLVALKAQRPGVAIPRSWSLITPTPAQAQMTLDPEMLYDAAAPIAGSLRVTIADLKDGQRAGVANAGFWGIPIWPGTDYRGSLIARVSADFSGPLTLSVESVDGSHTWTSVSIDKISTSWSRYEFQLKTGKVPLSEENRFVISAKNKGTIWIARASLFPPTYKSRPNGNRIDLMQKLLALHPAFLRYPSGDFVVGWTPQERFDWKASIGPVEKRHTRDSRWSFTSYGFGLLEFLQTCEDLNAQPVLCVSSGATGNSPALTGPALEPYVQDTVDEIEYISGDKSTPWGARRAADGHPEPFPLHYIQIGNNEHLYGRDTYDERFAQFHDAIKAKYPDIKLIAWGGSQPVPTSRAPDLVHEIQYLSALDLIGYSSHYDSSNRTGMRYTSEYCAREGDPTSTLNAALGNAAWLVGLERNADLAIMSAVAPFFVNVNPGAEHHGANAIGYDALTSFGSPSYYVVRLFSNNRGDSVLPVDVKPQELPPEPWVPRGAIGLGTWATNAQFKDIKVTRPDGGVLFQSDFSNGTAGWNTQSGRWSVDDGTFHQSSSLTPAMAMAGDPNWSDYTLTLKARRVSGGEGFLVIVHAADDDDYVWCNIGGFNNSRNAIAQTAHGNRTEISSANAPPLENNRWYDIRVEVKGSDISYSLDGAPVLAATESPPPVPPVPLVATASLEEKTGDIILKVVNVTLRPQRLDINLGGRRRIAGTATLDVIQGRPSDVNTIDSPEKIVPRQETIRLPGPAFTHEFPSSSVSVLRVHTQ